MLIHLPSRPSYLLLRMALVPVYSNATEKNYMLEEAVVHPLCKGSLDIVRWRITTSRRVVFPYDPVESNTSGTTKIIPPARFEKTFPKTWAYLTENRQALEDRERGKMRKRPMVWLRVIRKVSASLLSQRS